MWGNRPTLAMVPVVLTDSVDCTVSSTELGLGAGGGRSHPAGADVVRDLSVGHPRVVIQHGSPLHITPLVQC